jgi:hypothetical protein
VGFISSLPQLAWDKSYVVVVVFVHAYLFCVLTADVLYDFGTALEFISPLCPQLFLEVAGLGNFAKVHVLTCLAHCILQNVYIFI